MQLSMIDVFMLLLIKSIIKATNATLEAILYVPSVAFHTTADAAFAMLDILVIVPKTWSVAFL